MALITSGCGLLHMHQLGNKRQLSYEDLPAAPKPLRMGPLTELMKAKCGGTVLSETLHCISIHCISLIFYCLSLPFLDVSLHFTAFPCPYHRLSLTFCCPFHLFRCAAVGIFQPNSKKKILQNVLIPLFFRECVLAPGGCTASAVIRIKTG